MSNGNQAMAAMRDECVAAIQDIATTAGMPECQGHAGVARGLITLLRCQATEYDARIAEAAELRRFGLQALLRLIPYVLAAGAGGAIGGLL